MSTTRAAETLSRSRPFNILIFKPLQSESSLPFSPFSPNQGIQVGLLTACLLCSPLSASPSLDTSYSLLTHPLHLLESFAYYSSRVRLSPKAHYSGALRTARYPKYELRVSNFWKIFSSRYKETSSSIFPTFHN